MFLLNTEHIVRNCIIKKKRFTFTCYCQKQDIEESKRQWVNVFLFVWNTMISSGTSTGEISASLHQERYFSCIVSATPNSTKSYKPSYSDSLTSLDSLMLSGVSDAVLLPETPEVVRRSHPATGSMRNINNPKSSCKYHSDIHVGRTYSWLIFNIYMLYMYVH